MTPWTSQFTTRSGRKPPAGGGPAAGGDAEADAVIEVLDQ
jgi:hypothetical protein